MRKCISYLAVFLTIALFSCESTVAPSTEQKEDVQLTKDTDLPKTPTCMVPGKSLEGNKIWIPSKQIFAAIIADTTLSNNENGDTHRTFILMDKECKVIFQKVIEENERADYSYFLAPINYNNNSQLIGIKGFDVIHVFDLGKLEFLPKLTPSFLSERLGADAQSGQIIRLEIWENFLIGYAQDLGTFVFDLQDKSNPKAILPVAEYIIDESIFYSLFALPSDEAASQLIIPSFDFEKNEFDINPILKAPIELDLNLSKSVKNNNLIILREQNNKNAAIAINLKKRSTIALPEAIQTKKTSEIIKWIKAQ